MDFDNKNINVYWSDRLEMLADAMFEECEQNFSTDPFEKRCIVVGDMATRNWLLNYFLMKRSSHSKRIFANYDFKPLPEFINDWLAAFAHGTDSSSRRPSEHPYAKNVLAWRIDAILRACSDEAEFAFLNSYITGSDGRQSAKRRFALAERLAELFDSYLESRSGMLAQWERGNLPKGRNRWQALLYRMLVEGEANTYVKDYEAALADDADPAIAFNYGFPRYSSICAFDIAFAPWPFVLMLGRISRVIPVTFWNFNPSREYWFDNPSKKQAMREMVKALQDALRRGEEPKDTEFDLIFDSADSKMLGALASGARGVLAMELDLDENGCEWIGDEEHQDFDSIRRSNVELHICHSPRRELEVARDALHRFFDENRDASPSDALILCADWATYSPLVESVFAGGASTSIPVSVDGGVAEETPIGHSLELLFAFRDNRFEVNSVFELLSVPEISLRLGLSSEDISVLRDMVCKNNIHWGYDDKDVERIVGKSNSEYPFTWRRGLDRFIVDAMLGSRTRADSLVNISGLGNILPCGVVEDDRARVVGALNSFVIALNNLRYFMLDDHSAEEWRDSLLSAIDGFYKVDGEAIYELSALRRAIVATANSAILAREIEGDSQVLIPGDVFCNAVLASIKSSRHRVSTLRESIRFAPLNNGCAVPARFVWICGLNDGQFPRTEYRAAFDIVGGCQTSFDVSSRDKDAFALLKAAMGARGFLGFSYVGTNVHNNEEIPAAVPLLDLLDWMRSSAIKVAQYRHPLQSFSPLYFIDGPSLPPSYSKEDAKAAKALMESQSMQNEVDLSECWPFKLSDGTTYIDIDDLIAFFARPYQYLLRNALSISIPKTEYTLLSDEDCLDDNLPKYLRGELIAKGSEGVGDLAVVAQYLRESQYSVPAEILEEQMESIVDDSESYRERPLAYGKDNSEGFSCKDGRTISSAYLEWCSSEEWCSYECKFDYTDSDKDSHKIVLLARHKEVALDVVPNGTLAHTFNFSPWDKIYNSSLLESWIRHVVGHAAGKSFVTVNICTKDAPAQTFRPIGEDDAKEILSEIIRIAITPFSFSQELALQARVSDDDMPEAIKGLYDSVKDFVVKTGTFRRTKK